jgi:hypothetical protein
MRIIIQFLPSILQVKHCKNAGRGCIRNSLDSMWNIRDLFLNIGLAVVYFAQYVRAPIIGRKFVLGSGSILYNRIFILSFFDNKKMVINNI